ncbi:MAG: YqgE/AlgH family protein [Deltaproteobacteria bacterium]|nr:YqgE/AlgH family protein [Deltaproteobacteria bacterium]
MKTKKKSFLPCNWIPRLRFTRAPLATATIFALLALLGAALAAADLHTPNAKSFFLVASRDMPDPVFQQSVILMLPADEPPLVAGVIINKPTDVTIGNLFKQPLAPEHRSQKVYFGGPVDLTEPLLVVRTTRPPKPAIQLWSDVYAIADAGSISDILRDPRSSNDARLYVGRAQWAQEQLRGELLEGAWTVVPVKTDLIFAHDSAKIWPMLSQHEHVREIDARCFETGGVLASTMCSQTFTW